MINLGTDLFTLAETLLITKNKKYDVLDIIETAVKIRKKLDLIERNRKVAMSRYSKINAKCVLCKINKKIKYCSFCKEHIHSDCLKVNKCLMVC